MVDNIAVQELVNALKPTEKDSQTTYSAVVTRKDEEGVVWVQIAGSDTETPTESTSSEVDRGDYVNVEWRNNRLYIAGNTTNPAAGVSRVVNVERAAAVANEAAANAVASADTASEAASSALASATAAAADASEAKTSADEAAGSALNALNSLGIVEDVLDTVTWIAKYGEYVLTSDTELVDNKVYYTIAYVYAPTEDEAIDASKTYYTASVDYELTTDTAINPDKTYYTRTGSGTEADPYVYTEVEEPDVADIGTYYEAGATTYTEVESPVVADISTYYERTETYVAVSNPTVDDIATYYELQIDTSVENYINTHLALTDEGLYVYGNSSTDWKVLIADDGVYILDSSNEIIANYSGSISFADTVPFTIGNDNAYIKFYDSDDDNKADSIEISVDSLLVGQSSVNDSITALESSLSGLQSDLSSASDAISDIQTDVTELEKISGTILIDPATPQIVVGNGSMTNAVQTKNELSFTQNGAQAASYGSKSASVADMSTTQLNMVNSEGGGDLYWIMRSNGHLSLKVR